MMETIKAKQDSVQSAFDKLAVRVQELKKELQEAELEQIRLQGEWRLLEDLSKGEEVPAQ